jgi:hypothetical protein
LDIAPWLRYVIAFVVFCHGFIYVRIGAVLPDPIPAWRGSSGLLGNVIAGDALVKLSIALHVVAGFATLACAAAIALAASVPGWWRPLAITGSAIALLAFVVFWDGQAHVLLEQGAIGAAVSLLILLLALVSR